MRLTAANVDRFPGLLKLKDDFDAGPRPAAQAATAFLRAFDVHRPVESLTRLHIHDGAVAGFHSLAGGEVVLRSDHRKKQGMARSTQPAVIVTWIARSAAHPHADGRLLLEHAIGQAAAATDFAAATLLALDPWGRGDRCVVA